MRAGAKDIKTSCSGRLGGAEIARTEHYHDGTIPLQRAASIWLLVIQAGSVAWRPNSP